ncbi:MAG: hypothetical protein HY329_09010 [Chloroflexi bacterium]|nr:hypothetical protein [Chloroflexota bacterium]
MRVRADITCYHCGHVQWEVEGEFGVEVRQGLRCQRCTGPVYLDNIERVKVRPAPPPIMEPTRPRRGRPPKIRLDQVAVA